MKVEMAHAFQFRKQQKGLNDLVIPLSLKNFLCSKNCLLKFLYTLENSLKIISHTIHFFFFFCILTFNRNHDIEI